MAGGVVPYTGRRHDIYDLPQWVVCNTLSMYKAAKAANDNGSPKGRTPVAGRIVLRRIATKDRSHVRTNPGYVSLPGRTSSPCSASGLPSVVAPSSYRRCRRCRSTWQPAAACFWPAPPPSGRCPASARRGRRRRRVECWWSPRSSQGSSAGLATTKTTSRLRLPPLRSRGTGPPRSVRRRPGRRSAPTFPSPPG